MSQEVMDRRAAFRWIGKRTAGLAATVVVAAAGTEMDARRVFSDTYPISPEKQRELQSEARGLVDQGLVRVGTFSPVERTVNGEKKLQRPVLHPQGVAEALLYIAYMEGGDENVSTVNTFLRGERGFEVNQEVHGIPGFTEGPLVRLFKDSFSVALHPGIFEGDDYLAKVAHETYHVGQEARDGVIGRWSRSFIGAGILGAIALQLMYMYPTARPTSQEQKIKAPISRRKLLFKGVVGGILGGAAGFYFTHLSPLERQAYVQGGGLVGLGELTSQEPIKSALESVVTFEDVE